MKRTMKVVLIATLVVSLFTLPGCKKAFDYINKHPDDKAVPCQITKLKFYVIPYLSEPQYNVFDFTYDKMGNPVSVMRENLGPLYYDVPNIEQHFRYDKQNRLTDYELNYNGTLGVLEWHRYSYPDKHTIVDSIFNYTNSTYNDPEPPHASSDTRVSVYKLDAKGRIITDYGYDAKGNLMRPGVTYDDKININRTNKVWMQVFQDYSVNNPLSEPAQITGYNEFGLPLHFAIGSHLLGYDFDTMDVEYDCNSGKNYEKY